MRNYSSKTDSKLRDPGKFENHVDWNPLFVLGDLYMDNILEDKF